MSALTWHITIAIKHENQASSESSQHGTRHRSHAQAQDTTEMPILQRIPPEVRFHDGKTLREPTEDELEETQEEGESVLHYAMKAACE